MDCPRCGQPMEVRKTGDVEVDECSRCKGIWFDRDELRKAKDLADPDLNWMDLEIWKHKDQFHIASNPIKCPRCRIEMAAVNYGSTGVEVICCSKCEGTWLDGGVFERIITALEKELETKSAGGYMKSTLAEAKEILLGREGLRSEWKDLGTVMRLFEYRLFSEHPTLLNIIRAIQNLDPI
jgi:Zn-finger nucleic acid-binding protein